MGNDPIQGDERDTYVALDVQLRESAGLPTGREPYGNGVSIVVRGRESRPHGEGRQVFQTTTIREVRVMRTTETVLAVIRDRGIRGLPLERVYRLLFNRELYLQAYGRIYRNAGAMTPGSTAETVDGMSQAKIDTIIEAVRFERYRWTPVRRTYIPKPNGKKRPLGIPTWSDKLLQEVIRLILEAYYEPTFSDHSHGFRPNRGCHTALTEIDEAWLGTTWFIEGDIKGCFDNIDHQVLLSVLAEKIHDDRFVRLIANLLEAGYLEDWKYGAPLSGTPQGGIVSPILANIYLGRLDKFVETTLLPAFTRGSERKLNVAYRRKVGLAYYYRKQGHPEKAAKLVREAQSLPSRDTLDPEYRRLRFVRYADDFLLGFTGPKVEAEEIKRRFAEFLRDTLKLELSDAKTLITHARSHAARFLGYEIVVHQVDTKRTQGRRSINGQIGLKVPANVIAAKCAPFQMAENVCRLGKLKWVMDTSLTKTLAAKHGISVAKVYAKYRANLVTPLGTYKGLQVVVPRDNGRKPLVAQWGGIPLRRQKRVGLDDCPPKVWNKRTELLERLLADNCELCGSRFKVEVHHIRRLADLHKDGQSEKPAWAKEMAACHRKTLVVCRRCHEDIHAGRPRTRATGGTPSYHRCDSTVVAGSRSVRNSSRN
jgi:group II intron reverse transcriptase/maturase